MRKGSINLTGLDKHKFSMLCFSETQEKGMLFSLKNKHFSVMFGQHSVGLTSSLKSANNELSLLNTQLNCFHLLINMYHSAKAVKRHYKGSMC